MYTAENFKNSLIHFAFGKFSSVVLSISILLCFAQWMSPSDYGFYVSFSAIQSTLIAISSFGIETTTERYIPEIRIKHGDAYLRKIILTILAARSIAATFISITIYVLSTEIINYVGLYGQEKIFYLWIISVIPNSILFLNITILESMLNQKHSQRLMIIYLFIKFSLAFVFMENNTVSLYHISLSEIISLFIAASLSVLVIFLTTANNKSPNSQIFTLIDYKRVIGFAKYNYSAQIIFQFFSVELMKLFVNKILGPYNSAKYGFVCGIADTIQRYLPATLLARLIKPAFIKKYIQTGDFFQLQILSSLIVKINFLFIVPIVYLSIQYSDLIFISISKNKYQDLGFLLSGALIILLLNSHQLVLSIIAGTLEKNKMQIFAGAATIIIFPIAPYLIKNFGIYGALLFSIFSGLIYNFSAVVFLRINGIKYKFDFYGVLIIIISGSIAGYISNTISQFTYNSWLMCLFSFFSILIYLFLAKKFGAFSVAEIKIVYSIFSKKSVIL